MRYGIIPARAGSTPYPQEPTNDGKDHPRSRGEHSVPPAPSRSFSGSSPLARGAPPRPTRAASGGDHPRSRGEHFRRSCGWSGQEGSSPLARGALTQFATAHGSARIIPARAGSTGTTTGRAAPAKDHPRSRGEHSEINDGAVERYGSSPLARGALTQFATAHGSARIIPARAGSTPARHWIGARSWGSSPLARGAPWHKPNRRYPNGIIPARAGSTATPRGRPRRCRDHPRSRGEHRATSASTARASGSSPLARGARGRGPRTRSSRRIIPARAGSTAAGQASVRRESDHPRSRGEHGRGSRSGALMPGSSPLARGARAVTVRVLDREGIIPARAGSTVRLRFPAGAALDHPRSRGEHASACLRSTIRAGSSPLARGAPGSGAAPREPPRIIPARAGSTGRPAARRPGSADHPRSRGEHGHPDVPHRGQAGSSPLARGALSGRVPVLGVVGIIPARAGSTVVGVRVTEEDRDHPRSRGEHPRVVGRGVGGRGSSPLARGAQCELHKIGQAARIIPARAGSTLSIKAI